MRSDKRMELGSSERGVGQKEDGESFVGYLRGDGGSEVQEKMAEAMMEEVYENEVRKFGKLIITRE